MLGVSNSFKNQYTVSGRDGRLDDRQGPGEQELVLGVRRETADTSHRVLVGAPSAVVQPGQVVRLPRTVDADGHARPGLGKQVEKFLGEERPVGLNADWVALGSQLGSQAAKQLGEPMVAEQERLAPVQNDREARILPLGLIDQPVTDGGHHLQAHALRLRAPSRVRPLVDVAVRAIEVAPARGLDEDRVESACRAHVAVARATATGPDCADLCTRS